MARKGPANKTRRSTASGKISADNSVPDVYREMLSDAVSSSPTRTNEEGRAVKRRRVGGRIVTQGKKELASHQSDQKGDEAHDSELDELFEDIGPNLQQTLQSDSEDSADSDVEWEEVELQEDVGASEYEGEEPEALNLVLSGQKSEQESSNRGVAKRKPITAEVKKLRVEIHKMHLCSLMVHIYLRNHWCNDERIHALLNRLLTRKTVSYLNPDSSQSQFQRSRSFMDGVAQASEAFRGKFKVTARGMARPMWADSPETLAQIQPPEDIDLPMHLADFREVAATLKASRDVGAQLFCALLRSVGVNARLVCSLQLLPFQPAPKMTMSQVRRRAPEVPDQASGPVIPHLESDSDVKSETPGSTEQIVEYDGRGLGFGAERQRDLEKSRSDTSSANMPLRSRKISRKPIRESKYPVYWVEVFNEAVQKWVPVDPLVTRTIAKPSKFEPPAGEPENHMSYVVAFDDDGCARDTTRRYTKAYNAKTHRDRVEVTNGGERWLERVMKMYRRPHALDCDQVEDAELAAKEAAEPIPRNVQDFKDHPYYALERHLKRHEVIHPKREVGKVSAGRASSTNNLEPIYRRRDVHMVKSADKWYRLGREIKPGEQPLKRVPARRSREQILDPEDPDTGLEENPATALYAAHQTTLYLAPPVKNGRIPKNVYGNLDIYVPSMVPPGGTHITHPETARAARLLGIDYSDAVTGFTFKGRHGTAVINGAVICSDHREAVSEVLKASDDQRVRVEEERRSAEALRMWKRLLAGLKIRERIEGYEIEGERDAVLKEETEAEQDYEEEKDNDIDNNEGGGFLPDRDAEEVAQPTAGSCPRRLADLAEDEGGRFFADGSEEDSRGQNDRRAATWQARDPFLNNTRDDDGGGFLVNDANADAEEALRETTVKDFEISGARSMVDYTSDTVNSQTVSNESGGFSLATHDDLPQTNASVERPASPPSYQPLAPPSSQHPLETPLPEAEQSAPSLSPAELEEATLLQQLYESGTMNDSQPQHQSHPTSHVNGRNNTEPELGLKNQVARQEIPIDSMPQVTEENAGEDAEEERKEDDSDESDKGSLLSHDPEDEDAEPEWLT